MSMELIGYAPGLWQHGVVVARASVAVEDNERHWIEWHQSLAGQAAKPREGDHAQSDEL